MTKLRLVTVLAMCTIDASSAATDVTGHGRELFEKRCTGCHSLDTMKVGPPLRGVFHRRAAADPRFPYSEALKKAGLTWDEITLDRWLADPEALVPDNDMAFRLNRVDERSAIIVYLRQLTEKEHPR